MYVNSDINIATAQLPKDISDLAEEIGLLPHEVDLYGSKKAKVSLKVLDRLSHQQDGNYVIVTGSVSFYVIRSVHSQFCHYWVSLCVTGSGHSHFCRYWVSFCVIGLGH